MTRFQKLVLWMGLFILIALVVLILVLLAKPPTVATLSETQIVATRIQEMRSDVSRIQQTSTAVFLLNQQVEQTAAAVFVQWTATAQP